MGGVIQNPGRYDAILDEVTRRLAAACKPERICLCGFAARGDAGPDSDYEVLIVVPGDEYKETSAQAREAVRDLHFHTGPVVRPHPYLHERLHLKAWFPATVAGEGRLRFGDSRLEDHVEPTSRAQAVRERLVKAQTDLESARLLLAATPANALYHCQQAAEKPLKAFARHGVPIRKTHSVKKIGEKCRNRLQPEGAGHPGARAYGLRMACRVSRRAGTAPLGTRRPTSAGQASPWPPTPATRSGRVCPRKHSRERVAPNRDMLRFRF